MDESLKNTVYETMSEVFETMFFTFLEPMFEVPPEEEWDTSDSYIEAFISYEGEMSGVFRFFFPKLLARKITVNFLGIEESALEERQVSDTAGETANMTVGSLLGKLDPQGSSKLGMPQTKEIEDFSPAEFAQEDGLYVYNTDFGLLWMVHHQNK